MKKIFLYGIAGESDKYRIVKNTWIDIENELVTVRNLLNMAAWLKYKEPGIEHVYAVDDSAEMARLYKNTIKLNRMDENVEFKLMLEDIGLRII